MIDEIPVTLRYVKNGGGGSWWAAAKNNQQVHLGWKAIPHSLLVKPDFTEIKALRKAQFGLKRGVTQDFNQLNDLLNGPSQHIWMTFEDRYMWWCTVHDGAIVNPDGESLKKGNFWLACSRPWSNRSLGGKLLAMTDLPGTVTTVAGFKGTVCTPKAWREILRIIRDEKDPDAAEAAMARGKYRQAVEKIVKRLSPQDFEQLIDLILVRSGWARISTLGKVLKGIDLEVENRSSDEIAFVQVKSSATQRVLNNYVEQFENQRDRYARMIFAVHSPVGELKTPADLPVQLWTCDRVAALVVYAGLGEWVESRLA
jgi:Restriction endonuclease